jgi:hypothetical protein
MNEEEISNLIRKDARIMKTLEIPEELNFPNWENVNEVYAHAWNNLAPFTSTEDALSQCMYACVLSRLDLISFYLQGILYIGTRAGYY